MKNFGCENELFSFMKSFYKNKAARLQAKLP